MVKVLSISFVKEITYGNGDCLLHSSKARGRENNGRETQREIHGQKDYLRLTWYYTDQ